MGAEGRQEAVKKTANPEKTKSQNRRAEVMVVGLGGRGIQLLGRTLTEAGTLAYKHVTCLANYAPLTRGGASEATITFSDEEIRSPIMFRPRVLMLLSSGLVKKFESRMPPEGIVILDSSVIPEHFERTDIKVFPIPATRTATELGNQLVANMVLLGAYVGITRTIPPEVVEKALDRLLGERAKELQGLNLKAVRAGMDLVAGAKV